MTRTKQKKEKTPKAKPLNAAFNSKLLAKMILDKRMKEDLPLSHAAKAIGMSKSGIQYVEANGITTAATLPLIANWLGVTVQTFFS